MMIDFDLLAKNNCFLIDGTTVRFVSGRDGREFLAYTPLSREFDRREEAVRENEWCRKSLESLGLLVVYDFAVVDSFALEMSAQDVVDDDLIQVTSFPEKVILNCGLELMKSFSSLDQHYEPSELYWLGDDWNHSEWFEMPDKNGSTPLPGERF